MTETTTFTGLPAPDSAVAIAPDAARPSEVVRGAGKPIPHHPATELFPLMADAALDELVADIREHGLRDAIVMHPDGSLLDGRNRYRACEIVGVEPRTVVWDGEAGTELDFVVSVNCRRHLNESQRAMVAAKLATGTHGGDRVSEHAANLPHVPTQAQAAALLNVGERTVRTAAKVRDEAPAEAI
jgi:hypothetical protein